MMRYTVLSSSVTSVVTTTLNVGMHPHAHASHRKCWTDVWMVKSVMVTNEPEVGLESCPLHIQWVDFRVTRSHLEEHVRLQLPYEDVRIVLKHTHLEYCS